MAKFGDIIAENRPVLINFYEGVQYREKVIKSLKRIADLLEGKAKVVTIDVQKNLQLSKALEVDESPTFMIYKDGELKWRKTGRVEAKSLIHQIEQYA